MDDPSSVDPTVSNIEMTLVDHLIFNLVLTAVILVLLRIYGDRLIAPG